MSCYAYNELFTVSIDHLYYLNKGTTEFELMSSEQQSAQLKKYAVNDVIDIIPSKKCMRELKNHHLLFKQVPGGFVVATELHPTDSLKPLFSLQDITLTFYLKIKNAAFPNFTLLQLSPDSNDRSFYYFSNLAGNSAASFPDLSLPFPSYATGSDYEMGSIVRFDSNTYEAIQNIHHASTDPDQPSSGWRIISDYTSVNPNDRILHYPSIFDYSFSSAGMDLTFELRNRKSETVYSESAESSDEVMTHQLDYRMIEPGIYSLIVINNMDMSTIETRQFYLDDDCFRRNIFGIVEIFGDTGLGDYSVVSPAGNLQTPSYLLRFRNRSTIWRFIRTSDRTTLTEVGPYPLTHDGYIPVVHGENELPNPDCKIIKPESDQFTSEIYCRVV